MGCRCGRCWTGMKIAHCAACHETFSTPNTFDLHRRNGDCWPPRHVMDNKGAPALRESERGYWISARENPGVEQ